MKKIFESKIFLVVLTAIITASITIIGVNAINASQITYTNNSGDETTVSDTLDWFYSLLGTKQLSSYTFLPEYGGDRSVYTIPSGVTKVYVFYSTSTSATELEFNLTGDSIVSINKIAGNTDVDKYTDNLRSSLYIYEVILTGDGGTINASVSGGSGARRAWTTIIMY